VDRTVSGFGGLSRNGSLSVEQSGYERRWLISVERELCWPSTARPFVGVGLGRRGSCEDSRLPGAAGTPRRHRAAGISHTPKYIVLQTQNTSAVPSTSYLRTQGRLHRACCLLEPASRQAVVEGGEHHKGNRAGTDYSRALGSCEWHWRSNGLQGVVHGLGKFAPSP